jgi:hypothetical protein
LLGFTGPKTDAEQIKAKLAWFLRETLGLELNATKTLITHARSQRARFHGYDIIVQHSSTKISNGRRSANGKIALTVPPDVVRAQCARSRKHGKPWHRPRIQNLDDYDIVRVYGADYRGVVNYSLLAQDAWRLRTLRWHAETSMLKTLALKHQSTVSQMAARHKGEGHHRRRPQDLLPGQTEAEGQAGPGSTIRRDHPAARPAGGHHRPRPGPGPRPPQGTAGAAPPAGMRTLRDRHHGDSPPGRQTQRTRETGTGPASVGRHHGEETTQDAHRLRAVP